MASVVPPGATDELVRRGTVRRRDAEHDLNALTVNLDTSHQGTDHLPPPKPVKAVQPLADPLRKVLQTDDDQLTERCRHWIEGIKSQFAGTPVGPGDATLAVSAPLKSGVTSA